MQTLTEKSILRQVENFHGNEAFLEAYKFMTDVKKQDVKEKKED